MTRVEKAVKVPGGYDGIGTRSAALEGRRKRGGGKDEGRRKSSERERNTVQHGHMRESGDAIGM